MIDGIDAAACLLARHHLPWPSPAPSAVATGALLSAWLARQLDPTPPRHHRIRANQRIGQGSLARQDALRAFR